MNLRVHQTAPFVVEKIWGGKRLGEMLGKKNSSVGETWHASTLAEGLSSSLNFNKTLDQFLKLPYLLKLIDTSDHLSIQVHPDDQYAKEKKLDSGKSECWLILDAGPGSGIYLGLKKNITKEDFFKAVSESKDISTYLNFFEVKPGDFFYIPAGTIHAIGKDVFLAEVQQASGVTYRVWDWNRIDDSGRPRALHIKEAFEVTNFDDQFNQKVIADKKQNLFQKTNEISTHTLIVHPQFVANLVLLPSRECIIDLSKLLGKVSRPITLFLLKGNAQIQFSKEGLSSSFNLKRWDCLVSAEESAKINLSTKQEAQLLVIS